MAHVWHPTCPDATFATLHYFAPSIGAIHAHSDDPDTASLAVLCSFTTSSGRGRRVSRITSPRSWISPLSLLSRSSKLKAISARSRRGHPETWQRTLRPKGEGPSMLFG